MPEIIEVKLYSDFIEKKAKNAKLTEIQIVNGRYKRKGPFAGFQEFKHDLPLTIKSVDSKGKFMYIKFSNGLYLGVTLGLSGGWFWRPKGKKDLLHGLDESSEEHSYKYSVNNVEKYDGYMKKAIKHINVEFHTNKGDLLFYDTLSFGTMKLFDQKTLEKKLASLGLDIMDPELKFEKFREAFSKGRIQSKPIGNSIMDQKIIAGIGNYLRSDTLWMSKINPHRKVKDISEDEWKTIFHNARAIIWGSYDYNQGKKLKIISSKDKLPFQYKKDFFVYSEEKDPMGHNVIKEELYEGSQKRFIYWVKEVQK
jgi:formamidopyrimidine-DNA glycosylase